jgi:hypothetical protein
VESGSWAAGRIFDFLWAGRARKSDSVRCMEDIQCIQSCPSSRKAVEMTRTWHDNDDGNEQNEGKST